MSNLFSVNMSNEKKKTKIATTKVEDLKRRVNRKHDHFLLLSHIKL